MHRKRAMIKSVRGLEIGDLFEYDRLEYVAIEFPTRTSVCGRRVPDVGEPISCKVPLSQCNW